MSKCVLCLRKEATVPDRNRAPDRRKKICHECHGKRLIGDLNYCMKLEEERRKREAMRAE